MNNPKKIQTDSMYGKFGRNTQIILPRKNGRSLNTYLISLRAIDFNKSSIEKPSLEDEIKKCKEEDQEFYEAIFNNDTENILEEFHDRIMSSVNLLIMKGINLEDIALSQISHFNKLENRGIVFRK